MSYHKDKTKYDIYEIQGKKNVHIQNVSLTASLPQYATDLRKGRLKENISPKQEHITVNIQSIKTTCVIVWLLLVTSIQ